MRIILQASMILALLLAAPFHSFADSRYFPAGAIAQWQGEKFSVQRIEFLDEDSLERENLESWVGGNENVIAKLQASLRSNRALYDALRTQSVQINNVVAVTQALNGNLVVYLR
jgi:hypothetical protein